MAIVSTRSARASAHPPSTALSWLVLLALGCLTVACPAALPTPPAVATFLEQHHIPDTAPGRRAALRDANPEVRSIAATLAVWNGDDDAIPLLRAALAAEPANDVRGRLDSALAMLQARLVLRIEESPFSRDLPATVMVHVINAGDHDLVLPVPTHCNDSANGSVQLHLDVRPAPPGQPGLLKSACFIDSIYVPLGERLKSWKLLRPGESLAVTWKFEDASPAPHPRGTYDLWAEYTPPFVSFDDLSTLMQSRRAVPRMPLLSEHVALQKP